MGQSRDAFTLVELTMVMVIIGVLAAVAVPRFMDDPMRLRSEGRLLLTHLRFAQQHALSQGVDVEVRFRSGIGYSVVTSAGDDVPDPLGGGALIHRFAPSVQSVTTNLSSSRLVFDHRLGAPSDGSGALSGQRQIVLTSNSDSMTIRIHPNTGFAEVL